MAENIRAKMGVKGSERLDALALARHVGADIRQADVLISIDKLKALERLQPGAFSACTFTIGGRHIVVFSPLASEGRTQPGSSTRPTHAVF